MKKRAPKYRFLVTHIVIVVTSIICASENKTLVQDILTTQSNRCKGHHQLSSHLIGSMVQHNNPLVSFVFIGRDLNKTYLQHKQRAILNSLTDNDDRSTEDEKNFYGSTGTTAF